MQSLLMQIHVNGFISHKLATIDTYQGLIYSSSAGQINITPPATIDQHCGHGGQTLKNS